MAETDTRVIAPTDDERVIDLVLGVARLGEASLRGWWQSHGLDQAGQYVLGGSFPRTWLCAALELAVASAKRRHEEMLGRPTALHLFSDELPFHRLARSWLAEQKTGGDTSRIDSFASWTTETAITSLRSWAGTSVTGEVVGTGLLLGRLNNAELRDSETLTSIANQLTAGYVDQPRDFRAPYFDLTRD